jgi:predicted DNA-binding transcriptional regulator AlpA
MSDLLSTKQVSERFGFTVAWLERQRWLGTGPKYVKLGRMVKYRISDIEQYLNDCSVSPGMMQNGA